MIDNIKSIDILDVAERLGIQHNNGKSNVACFKGHDSNTKSLSFNIKKNEFKCFGCGIGGDPMDLVAARMNCGFKETVEWFSDNYDIENEFKQRRKQTVRDVLEKEEKMAAAQVVESKKEEPVKVCDETIIRTAYMYFSVFFEKGINGYFKDERGVGNKVIADACIVKIDSKLISDYVRKNVLFPSEFGPYYDFIWRIFEEIGVLSYDIPDYIKESGLMSFKMSSYAIPFYSGNEIIGMQGVNLGIQREKYSKYSYLKDREKPLLYIPPYMQNDDGSIIDRVKSVFVTEGVIDCLSLVHMGVDAIAMLDSSVTENDARFIEFNRFFYCDIYLLLDNDSTGEIAKNKTTSWLQDNYFEARARCIQEIAESIGITEKIKDANELLLKLIKAGHDL